MSTVKLRKKRAGSAQESKKLDDGAGDATRHASDLNALHPQWEKVINDEIRDNLCLQIREEVFETLFQICYEKYLEKQVIDFTVHCAHQAFLKVASVFFIKLDPGEKPVVDNPSWTPDKEPAPSRMDPWLSFTVPVVERKPEPEPQTETPTTPAPSPVTEASPVTTSARKMSDEEELSGLALQVYERYQPSTEWPPAAVESVMRHSAMPAKPKPPPEEPPKEQPKRPPGGIRKSKPSSSKPAEMSEKRPARLPPIKSKSDVKKAVSGAGSPSAMEIPRPPVIPISALPPSRAEVKCTVVPFKDIVPPPVSVKKQLSRRRLTSVRWSKSTKDISKDAK